MHRQHKTANIESLPVRKTRY